MNAATGRQVVSGLAGLMLLAGSLAGCGSSSASNATKATCTSVSAVLSDGPDSGADPVGYAQAQIRPLRQIQTSDASLRGAIADLASAYQSFSTTNGGSVANQDVKKASSKVDAICPGATS